MKPRKTIILMLTGLMLLPGCVEIKADNPNTGKYATQNRESAVEYGIYMNKQIQVFINQISSRQGIIKNTGTDNAGTIADNEITLAEQSLKTMQETYDETATVYPSAGSDDERESTLVAMQTAMDHMQGYINDLRDGKDIKGYSEDFQNDFNQLTALANLYNQ